MAASSERRSFADKWKQPIMKGAAIVAMGASAMFMAGCGPSNSHADHAPTTPPAATASQTPGSHETSPSQSPSSSETQQSSELKLTDSEVFNSMSAADQAKVEKDVKLSFDQFEQLDYQERSLVTFALVDAGSKDYIKEAGELVLPGHFGDPLKDIYAPATGQHTNLAEEYYKVATTTLNTEMTIDNDAAPYFYQQYALGVAFDQAKTGDQQGLENAKKIVGGLLFWTGDKADASNGNLAGLISQLEEASTNKSDPDTALHFPQSTIDAHNWVSRNSIILTFKTYDSATQSYKPGQNELGNTGAVYQPGPQVKLKDGTTVQSWVLNETSSDGSTWGTQVTPDQPS